MSQVTKNTAIEQQLAFLDDVCDKVQLHDTSSNLTADWFDLNHCYQNCDLKRMAALESVELFKDPELQVVCSGLYLILFEGISPSEWPSDVGALLWYTVYYYSTDSQDQHIFDDYNYLKNNVSVNSKLKESILGFENCHNATTVQEQTAAVKQWVQKIIGFVSSTINPAKEHSVENHVKMITKHLHPLDNSESFQEFATQLLKQNATQRFIRFLLYFLRLAVKGPNLLIAHYRRQRSVILGWAGISEFGRLGDPDISMWETIAQSLNKSRSMIMHHTVVMYICAPLKYEEIKKWYSSRWEFFGLTHITTLKSISSKITVGKIIREFATADTIKTIIRVIVSYTVYGGLGYTYTERPHPDLHMPVLTLTDAKLGRFARCYDTKYLTWMTFNYNLKLTALFIGAATHCNPFTTAPESIMKDDNYMIGKYTAELMSATIIQDDPFAGKVYKQAVKKNKTTKEEQYAGLNLTQYTTQQNAPLQSSVLQSLPPQQILYQPVIQTPNIPAVQNQPDENQKRELSITDAKTIQMLDQLSANKVSTNNVFSALQNLK